MEISDILPADLTNLQAQGYTESDLSMLAKSEVQALLDVPADDAGERSNADHDAAAAEQDAAAKPAVAGNESKDAAAEPPEPVALVPQFKVDVPADAKEQIATLKGEEKAAFKRMMDGEIDADEYQVVRERTEAAADELKTKALTASIFEQANQQTAEQTAQAQWNAAETAAFNEFTAEGLDYRAKPALLAAYNHSLQALGKDPKNEKRDAPWFLAEAHRITKDALGIAPTAKKVDRDSRSVVDLSDLPPTLRSVPIAATGAVNSDEFAHMRNLEGLELERAHARLTNDQRDRWMAE